MALNTPIMRHFEGIVKPQQGLDVAHLLGKATLPSRAGRLGALWGERRSSWPGLPGSASGMLGFSGVLVCPDGYLKLRLGAEGS